MKGYRLTVSYKYVDKHVTFPTPSGDLYGLYEGHHDDDEIEDYNAAPGHGQIFNEAINVRTGGSDTATLTPCSGNPNENLEQRQELESTH